MVRVSVLTERDTHRDSQTDRQTESMIRVNELAQRERQRKTDRQCSVQWIDGLCRDSMVRVSVLAERDTHTQRWTDRQKQR